MYYELRSTIIQAENGILISVSAFVPAAGTKRQRGAGPGDSRVASIGAEIRILVAPHSGFRLARAAVGPSAVSPRCFSDRMGML